MRETTNLKLTQFDGNDIPNWLDQYNSDMAKIDVNAGSQKTTNAETENKIYAINQWQTNTDNRLAENETSIANLKQSTIPAINDKITSIETEIDSLDGRLETVEDGLTGVETLVGNSAITNVAATVTTAIGNTSSPFENGDLSGNISRMAAGRIQKTIEPSTQSAGKAVTGTVNILKTSKHYNVVEFVFPTMALTGAWTENIPVTLGTINFDAATDGAFSHNADVSMGTLILKGRPNIELFARCDSTHNRMIIVGVSHETYTDSGKTANDILYAIIPFIGK